MIDKSNATMAALMAIGEVFGVEYLREHLKSPVCQSINNGVFTLSYLFQDSKQRPDLTPDHLGWTVYATVDVDMETGMAKMVDYVLPDGTKMRDNT